MLDASEERIMEMWAFETLDVRPAVYVDLGGKEHDLALYDDVVRDDLAELITYYNEKPPYPQFKTFWHAFDSPISLHMDGRTPMAKVLFAIGRDLEKRLGISQGRVRP